MIVEVMVALIVVGAAMVLFVRYQGGKGLSASEQQDMRESTQKLKAELERSGNEIIQRMGSHVEQLERLIRETEEKTDLVNRRIAELQALRQGIQQQLAEGRIFQQQLAEQYRLCQNAYQQMGTYLQMSARQARPAPMAEPAPPSVWDRPAAPAPPYGQTEVPSFSQLLHESMERDPDRGEDSQDLYEPSAEARQMAQQMAERRHSAEASAGVATDHEASNKRASDKARYLLREGRSVEEVSRETGMGRGAVELLRQIVQHQLET